MKAARQEFGEMNIMITDAITRLLSIPQNVLAYDEDVMFFHQADRKVREIRDFIAQAQVDLGIEKLRWVRDEAGKIERVSKDDGDERKPRGRRES